MVALLHFWNGNVLSLTRSTPSILAAAAFAASLSETEMPVGAATSAADCTGSSAPDTSILQAVPRTDLPFGGALEEGFEHARLAEVVEAHRGKRPLKRQGQPLVYQIFRWCVQQRSVPSALPIPRLAVQK